MSPIDFAAIISFAGILLFAAWGDLRRLLIPNRLSLAIVVLWLAHLLAAPAAVDPLGALAVALVIFALGFALFAVGMMGGGDVKLLTATALWAGPALWPELLVVTTACGGVIAVVLLTPQGAWFEARIQDAGALSHLRVNLAPGAPRRYRPMPYGVAIAAGGLVVVLRLLGF
jgi:prepilin peptidase CpaA